MVKSSDFRILEDKIGLDGGPRAWTVHGLVSDLGWSRARIVRALRLLKRRGLVKFTPDGWVPLCRNCGSQNIVDTGYLVDWDQTEGVVSAKTGLKYRRIIAPKEEWYPVPPPMPEEDCQCHLQCV